MQRFMKIAASANHTVMKILLVYGFLVAMASVTHQMICPFLRYAVCAKRDFMGFTPVLPLSFLGKSQADARCKANVSKAIQPMEPEHKFYKTDEFRNVVHALE